MSKAGPSGFLNILKPPGMTSHDVVDLVRRMLPRKWKVGHLGTLDPAAAGVLPLAVGTGTKLIPLLPDLGDKMKSYLGHIQLGVTTSTDDLEGDVMATSDFGGLEAEEIKSALTQFVGHIEQIPPQVSAIRTDGVRAYELARQGQEVALKARPVQVSKLEFLDYHSETGRLKTFMVCGSGTYVRSVARDLGSSLGVGGALAFLLRTHSGPFHLSDAISLEELRAEGVDGNLIPLTYPFESLPKVSLSVELQSKGQKVAASFPQAGLYCSDQGLLRVTESEPNVAVVEALFTQVTA